MFDLLFNVAIFAGGVFLGWKFPSSWGWITSIAKSLKAWYETKKAKKD